MADLIFFLAMGVLAGWYVDKAMRAHRLGSSNIFDAESDIVVVKSNTVVVQIVLVCLIVWGLESNRCFASLIASTVGTIILLSILRKFNG